jgi:putative transposase
VLVLWLGISLSKFYDWRKRYGKVNEHNARVPRDHWLSDEEKQAILDYERQYPLEGYRRLTFMMLDDDVAAAGPATVYRVLKSADRLQRPSPSNDRKGQGFHQPSGPHRHWHIDFSHLNICGTFYRICSIIDGYSRYGVPWEIRETIFESDAEIAVQRAREKLPGERPRILSDNGPQFLAKDFKQFIRLCGMTHVTTSPCCPQSNGKKERWFGTLKREWIRPGTPLSLEDARRLVARFVEHYNTVRLHSAIGYVTPADKLLGLEPVSHAERDRKLDEARQRRQDMRQAARGDDDPRRHGDPTARGTHGERSPLDLTALRRQASMGQVLRHPGYLDPFRAWAPNAAVPAPCTTRPATATAPSPSTRAKGSSAASIPRAKRRATRSISGPPITACRSAKAAEHLAKAFAAQLTSPEKPLAEKRNP